MASLSSLQAKTKLSLFHVVNTHTSAKERGSKQGGPSRKAQGKQPTKGSGMNQTTIRHRVPAKTRPIDLGSLNAVSPTADGVACHLV
jgi:hypothetical protein